jgi:hypothetical protein
MNFRTIVEPKKSEIKISHRSQVLIMGSCFTENIGQKLQELKFNINVNPFGVLFNPLSVAKSLERLLSGKLFRENELFYNNDCWHSFLHHSKYSSPVKDLCLKQINEQFTFSSNFIRKLDVLILTFGTAWTYYNINNGEPVSNCHKLPSSNFEKKLLTVFDIVEVYKQIFSKLLEQNPGLKIILTISPVRHLGDGAHENQISKSILHLAVHELCNLGVAEYFPAYEIVMDDLRDYRFYNADMAHPSKEAIDYIFEKFANSYFALETLNLTLEIEKIITASSHRPINANSDSYKKFAQNTLDKISNLLSNFPYLDFSKEIKTFNHFV